MSLESKEEINSGLSVERMQEISEAVATASENFEKSREVFKDLSRFNKSPLATSSPLSRSNLEVQQLKAHLATESLRRSQPRSEPFSFENIEKPFDKEQSSSNSEKDLAVTGILKKNKNAVDLMQASESAKEINVYQSGGVLIVNTSKDHVKEGDKEKMSEVTSKLIEESLRLTESLKEVELKPEGKMVQFDLGSDGSAEARSGVSRSPAKDNNTNFMESNSRSRGAEQPSSLSTNDSLPWQPAGPSSPSSTASIKRLEWDSGADVGYQNVEIAKEEISTIERDVIKRLEKQRLTEAKVLQRGPRTKSNAEEPSENSKQQKNVVTRDFGTNPDAVLECEVMKKRDTSDCNTQTVAESGNCSENVVTGSSTNTASESAVRPMKSIPKLDSSDSNISLMKDESTFVNTLGSDYAIIEPKPQEVSKPSPRIKKLKKRRSSAQCVTATRAIKKIHDIKEAINKVRNAHYFNETERKVEEIVVDHSYREDTPEERRGRPTSASSGSNITVLPKVEDKPVQTSDRATESKGVQVSEKSPKLKSSKNIQASGELNSLPKHLDNQMLQEMFGGEVRTKCTQFFGGGVNSLPQALVKASSRNKAQAENDKIQAKKTSQTSSKKTETGEVEGLKLPVKSNPQPLEKKSSKSEKRDVAIKPTKSGSSTGSDKNAGLTVQAMRERNDAVDSSIIHKKFFESQERLMVSKSTSTDPESFEKIVSSVVGSVSVGIQYSPKEDTKEPDISGQAEPQVKDMWTDTLDSQASSTQTAHSWVHKGVSRRNNVVRPTRSFEYLPGDVYESSVNLREQLPRELCPNVSTETSSSPDSDKSRPSAAQPYDFEGFGNLKPQAEDVPPGSINNSPGTVVLDDSTHSNLALHAGAWALVPGDDANALKLVRKPAINGASELSRTTGGSSLDDHRGPSSVAVQTEYVENHKDTRNDTLKRLLRELVEERRLSQLRNAHSLDRKKSSASHPGKSTGNISDRSVSNSKRGSNLRDISLISPRNIDAPSRKTSTPLSSTALEVSNDVSCKLKDLSASAPESMTASLSESSDVSVDRSALISEKDSGCRISRNKSKGKALKNQMADAITQYEQTQRNQSTQMSDSSQPGSNKHRNGKGHRSATPRDVVEIATQMSSPIEKCMRCSKIGCTCSPHYMTETGTQSSWTLERCAKCGKSECACQRMVLTEIGTQVGSSLAQCRSCGNDKCKCQSIVSKHVDVAVQAHIASSRRCSACKKHDCVCHSESGKRPEEEKKNVLRGEEFSSFFDVDLSSSEVTSSGSGNPRSSSKRKSKSSSSNKENAQCSVCLCVKAESQRCRFCICHVDEKLQISRCDCHSQSVPKILLSGFCKCHRRNQQYFNGCKCQNNDQLIVNNCPCCEYFYQNIMAKMYASYLDDIQAEQKKPKENPKPKNYFLNLEETEISKDSTDVSEPEKKPVEVITIKIPVRRFGKKKVPTNKFYYADDSERNNLSSNNENDVEYLEDIIRRYRSSSDRKKDRIEVKTQGTEKSSGSTYRSLQEWLESNRPDFYSSAESRRRLILARSRDRENNQQCKIQQPVASVCPVPKRIFTTSQLKQQTLRRYRQLSEVTQKNDERKKRDAYRTNKIMADIYAKKLQLKTLRGEVNLSNSFSLLSS